MKISLKLKSACLALLLIGSTLSYGERTGVANTSPETGTTKMIVKNNSEFGLDITVGTETRQHIEHFGNAQFLSATQFTPPYLVEVRMYPINFAQYMKLLGKTIITGGADFKEDVELNHSGPSVKFENPKGIDGYQTPIQTIQLETMKKAFSEENATVKVRLTAQYTWKDGYWIVNIRRES